MKKYPHVVARVLEEPWAILPSTLAVMAELVRLRMAGIELQPEEVQARLAAVRREPQPTSAGDSVAVLPIEGVILRHASVLEETSGALSLESWVGRFRAAIADPGVGAVVVPIDSPGGEVDGMTEAAAEIRAGRDRKPVLASANTMAASAAYWLASQATEVSATPSGQVGSIGVFTWHEDWSGFYDQKGIRTTLISAGKYKTEGNEFAPLTDEARAYYQSQIDKRYASFVGDVAKGRGVKVEQVRSDYGEGRMLLAKDALDAGMVDRIETVDATLGRAQQMASKAAAQRAVALLDPTTVAIVPEPTPEPGPDPEPEPTPEPDEAARRFAFEREKRQRSLHVG